MKKQLCKAFLTVLAATLITGCGTPPRASISGMAVFTPGHISAIHNIEATNSNLHSITKHMARYFGTNSASYESNKLRMDVMLDQLQQRSALSQRRQVETLLNLQLLAPGADVVNSNGVTAAAGIATNAVSSSGAYPWANDPAFRGAVMNLVTNQMAGEVFDSPFDTLDRVSDFYAAYLLKVLRLYPDSTSVRESDINKMLGMENAPKPEDAQERTLVFVFQSHVDPGTGDDRMTGIEIELRCGEDASSVTNNVDAVRIHPTRAYDLDSTIFADTALQIAKLQAAGKVSSKLAIEAERKAAVETELFEKFIARIGKVGSYADAGESRIGWNFFPSNFRVQRVNAAKSIFGWTIGIPKKFDVKAVLDGGGRDCMAVVKIPSETKYVKARTRTFYAKMSPANSGFKAFGKNYLDPDGRKVDMDESWGEWFNIPIPKTSASEGSVGVGILNKPPVVAPN
jgi:hypothetical protein